LLAQSEVVGYLLDRGLLSAESIVDGDLVVRDASSRNRNFMVERRRATSYLVKQGFGPDGVATVAHEAAAYQALSRLGAAVGAHLPRFYGYDHDERVLILELVRSSEGLASYHLRLGRFPRRVAAALGDALGALHRLTWRGSDAGTLPALPPWILSVHRPDLSVFRDSSTATIELIKIVQQSADFCSHLDQLQNEWHAQALIHQDVKWDNIIVFASSRGQSRGVKLVDWESAVYGDPCWDIGSVFSSYLSFWLSSIPVTGRNPPERFAELARYPLSKMQAGMYSCWQAYVKQLGLNGFDANRWLLRTVRLAAARLLQAAFEASQMTDRLTGSSILHAQLSLNMLDRPRETAVHLLGISFHGAEAA
jgi:aminoglycoside phosphotransferase (APT) family kinase protein